MARPYYGRIGPDTPARATLYPGGATDAVTRAPNRREFRSLEELARFLKLRAPLRRTAKEGVPLLVRAWASGPRRRRRDLEPPYLTLLDVDESPVPMEATSARLSALGVAHLAHTTWSHSGGPRHSYRVYSDCLAWTWEAMVLATERLKRLAGVGEVESKTVGSYVPAVHPSRARAYRWRIDPEGSAWWEGLDPEAEREERGPRDEESADAGDWDPEELREALSAIDNGPREGWIRVGMALRATGRAEARDLWDEWSSGQGYPDYRDEAQERAWESFAGPGEARPGEAVTLGSVFRMARDAGWRPERERRAPAREDFAGLRRRPEDRRPEERALVEVGRGGRVELDVGQDGRALRNVGNACRVLATMDLGLAHDVLADRVMLLGAGVERLRRVFPKLGRVFEDRTIHALVWAIREGPFGIEFSVDAVHRACVTEAMARAFNPVADWLERLRWDGEERVATWAARLLGAEGPLAPEAGRILLEGAVARALSPGVKMDQMVVLEGPQGCGKSSAVRILGGEYTLEGLPTGDLRSKDVVTALLGKWFVELDELDVARKADVEALKSFLSRTEDRARPAYARETRDFPRRCVFVGTTNDSAYLKDSTGNRRFLPVRVGWVDLRGLEAEREQLLAEATARWREDPRPERLQLGKRLWRAASEEQESRRVADPWEDALEEYLARGEARDSYTPGELLRDAIGKPESSQQRNDYDRVRKAMDRLGWLSGTHRRPRGEGEEGPPTRMVRGYVRPGSRLAARHPGTLRRP